MWRPSTLLVTSDSDSSNSDSSISERGNSDSGNSDSRDSSNSDSSKTDIRAWLHRETMDFFRVKIMVLKKF